MKAFWQNKLWGITYRELGLLFLFYAFFGVAYRGAISLASQGDARIFPDVLLDYGLKALLTIPIWWLIFRKLSHWKLWQKLCLHVILLPVFLISWQQLFYWICDLLGVFHLNWPFAWWDIYIPGLFYGLQFGIYHFYDFYLKLQRQRELEAELRQAALQSELAAIKAQLNPHFLYNTFNAISASVPPELEKTREMIAKLSDMFRYQLKSTQTELIPLREELNFVRTYLELEKARFGNRLKFSFRIEDALCHFLIPPMIIQPLIENAVKHGITPKIDGGCIEIKVYQQDRWAMFEILDTGVGEVPNSHTAGHGMGITYTAKRLNTMYRSRLEYGNRQQGGFEVKFKIPLDSQQVSK